MSTVGTAKIIFEADAGKVSEQLQQSLQRSLDKIQRLMGQASTTIERDAGRAGQAIGDKVTQGADRAGKAMGDIDGKGLGRVEQAAAKAGAAVGDKLSAGAGKASAAVDGIGGKGLGRVEQAAAKAGATIGSKIGEGSARAAASTSKISDAAGRAAASSGSAFDRVGGRISGAFSKASGAAAQAGSAVRKHLDGAFRESERSALRIPSALQKVGLAALAIGGPAAMLKGGFDRLMDIQRAEIGFKNIGLSAEETKAQMARLSDQVTDTSVSLSDAAKYSAMFAQSGIEMGKPMDSAIKAFTNLAAAASGSSTDVGLVMQQISAAGRLMGGDAAQLQNVGINIYKYVADYMGKSVDEVKKLGEQGKITFEDVVGAINAEMGDYAKQMGQTLPAKMSNLKTAVANLGATLLEPFIGPMTAAVNFGTAILKGVVGPLKRLQQWLQSGSTSAEVFKGTMKVLGSVALGTVAVGLAGAVGWMIKFGGIASLLGGKLGFIARAVVKLRGVFHLLRAGVFIATGALRTLGITLLTTPIGWIALAIAAVVAAFVLLWRKSEAFRDFWKGLWETIKSAAGAAWEWLKGLFAEGSFLSDSWDRLVTVATTAWEVIKAVWSAAGDFYAGLFGGIIEVGRTVFGALADVVRGVWETVLAPMINGIRDTWGSIMETIAPAVEWLRELWSSAAETMAEVWRTHLAPVVDRLREAFAELSEKVGGFISEHWETIKMILMVIGGVLLTPIVVGLGLIAGAIGVVVGIIVGAIWVGSKVIEFLVKLPGMVGAAASAVRDWFARAWQSTKDAFSRMGQAISGWWQEHVAPLPGKVGGAVRRIIDWFRGLPRRIRGALADAASWLVGIGRQVVQGFINGVSGWIGRAVGKVREMASRVKNAAKSFLGIHSPSRVFMEIGAHVGEGMALGMERARGRVATAAETMAGSAVGPARAVASRVPVPAPAVAAPPVPAAGPPPAAAAGEAAGAFRGMADSLSATAAGVIGPVWAQTQAGVQSTAAAVQQQALGVMAPAWARAAGMMAATRQAVVSPVMAGVRQDMAGTAAAFPAQVWGVISPALQGMQRTMWWVKNSGTDPVFRAISGGLQWVVRTFAWAVGQIGAQWARVREATARPVRFTIQSVFNDGLVGMWNSVAELLGTSRMGRYPVRFATGGHVRGPGGPTDDKIPALLSDGEYVMRADAVRRLGVDNLNAMNSGKVGAVTGALRSRRAQQEMLQDSTFRRIAARFSGGGIVKGTPAWHALLRGWKWAKSRSGRPYVFGGSAHGSGGTDCSGYMSGISDVIRGGDGRRQWATGNFPGTQRGAWAPGLAAGFSVGIRNGGPGGGHTAGTIGGVEGIPAVNVESGGSPSRVKFGAGAVGATDSYFNRHYHMRVVEGGRFVPGSGSGVSMGELVAGAMRPHLARMNAAAARYAGGGRMGALPRLVKDRLESAARKKIDKLIAQLEVDPGGSGVQRWAPLVKWLLHRYGHPQSWLGSTLRRMNQESGGNPRAINNWDINAKRGDPSKGLMQVIGSTFARWRDRAFPNDIWNPKSNIAASMRYTMARYGSLPAGYDRAGGYHRGGLLPGRPGLFEKTALAPERVLSPRQTESFERLVDWLDSGRRLSVEPAERGTRRAYGDGRTTRQVLVTQNIHGGDARDVADTVEDRLLALMI